MKRYIFALILGISVILCGQSAYAQTVNKNILADVKLMKTITPEQLEKYIAQGADVNARDKDGWTPLMYAAGLNQNPKVIETLLKHGADVNAKGKDGVTPLMSAACVNKNPEIVETLLKHGADKEMYIKIPVLTATYIALGKSNHKVFEMLIASEIDKFCHLNRSYSHDIYYCKDRLTLYMQKEHLLPSCVNDVKAMLALTPFLQSMIYIGAGKSAYFLVSVAEITSKFNCSIKNTLKDLGGFDKQLK